MMRGTKKIPKILVPDDVSLVRLSTGEWKATHKPSGTNGSALTPQGALAWLTGVLRQGNGKAEKVTKPLSAKETTKFLVPDDISLVELAPGKWKAAHHPSGVNRLAYTPQSALVCLMEVLGRTLELDFMDEPAKPLSAPPGYESLVDVLSRALEHASVGKGQQRHAHKDEAFEDQKICQINRWLRGPEGALFQAVKKTLEAKRLEGKAAVHELLGAINYLAAAVIVIEGKESDKG